MYRPPSEKKDFHTRCHTETADSISFEITRGLYVRYKPKDVVATFENIMEQGDFDYMVFSTRSNPDDWTVHISVPSAASHLGSFRFPQFQAIGFGLRNPNDHEKVRAFLESLHYGEYHLVSVTSEGFTIILTKEKYPAVAQR